MRRHPQFINRIVAEELRKALLKRMSGSVTLIVDLEAHAAHRKPSGGRRRALDHDNSGPDQQVHYGGVQTGDPVSTHFWRPIFLLSRRG